jgi:hypothetical protein
MQDADTHLAIRIHIRMERDWSQEGHRGWVDRVVLWEREARAEVGSYLTRVLESLFSSSFPCSCVDLSVGFGEERKEGKAGRDRKGRGESIPPKYLQSSEIMSMTSHSNTFLSSTSPHEIPGRSLARWISFSWRASRPAVLLEEALVLGPAVLVVGGIVKELGVVVENGCLRECGWEIGEIC